MAIDGHWAVTIESFLVQQDGVLELESDGATLSGTFIDRAGAPIRVTGGISGKRVELVATFTGVDAPMLLRLTGELTDDTMGGAVELGEVGSGTWSATRS